MTIREEYQIDVLVIGAGVVGLAIARQLARAGKEVWLLEREDDFGMQTSSRNSEVIHAGIYYPRDSLKAKLCVAGKELLYGYCQMHQIPHRRCGKLIVATSQVQREELKSILKKARLNGVTDLVWLDQDGLQQMEPELKGLAALYSPSTGVIDSHQYMRQLLTDFEQAGGHLVLKSKVSAIQFANRSFELEIEGQNVRLNAQACINSCGLQAVDLLKDVSGFPQQSLPKEYFAKGSYFTYSGRTPFSHLVYPVPEPGGLGIHLTLDQGGMARFGPDVEWLKSRAEWDYHVDETKRDAFYHAIRRYWPGVDRHKLVPDYSGIRPKVSGPNDPAGDFLIQGEESHGLKGLVNLFGIESPGLTASLAIAEHVETLICLPDRC